MHQTGLDVNARASTAATAANDEASTRMAVKTAAPLSTAQAILTQSVRLFDRALFNGGRLADQKSGVSTKESRQTSSDDKSSASSPSELRGGDAHGRVEAREGRQDQSGSDSGGGKDRGERQSDVSSDAKSDSTKSTLTESRGAGSGSGSTQGDRGQSHSNLTAKEAPVPERLEEVVAEVTAAMKELGSAGEKEKKKFVSDDLSEFAVGFTLVEQDDEDPKFRRFLMYAEDDDLMEEPWSIRFNEDEIYLEIYMRDPKQIPMMMKQAADMEAEMSERIGIKVVLSFKTFAKGMIL
jgi:hypothetical protein